MERKLDKVRKRTVKEELSEREEVTKRKWSKEGESQGNTTHVSDALGDTTHVSDTLDLSSAAYNDPVTSTPNRCDTPLPEVNDKDISPVL